MQTQQAHPLVRAAAAVSLDGYIADKNGGADWLNAFFSNERDFVGFMKGIGAAIMGRKTFDHAIRIAEWPPTNYPTFVLTNRPITNPPARCQPIQGEAAEIVQRLRAQLEGTGKDIWLMGGGISIEYFRAAGLVDRLELALIPVLLGGGIPLFPPRAVGEQRWKLIKDRGFTNGTVELWYERAP
jgi:dihydrofolate reductase